MRVEPFGVIESCLRHFQFLAGRLGARRLAKPNLSTICDFAELVVRIHQASMHGPANTNVLQLY